MKQLLIILSLFLSLSCFGQTMAGAMLSQQQATSIVVCTNVISSNLVTVRVINGFGTGSTSKYKATFFVAPSTFNLCGVSIITTNFGSPTQLVNFYIYNDSGTNTPGTTLIDTSTTVLDCSTLPPGQFNTNSISFNGVSLTSGTTYWLEVVCQTVNSSNYPQIVLMGSFGTAASWMTSSDNVNWTSSSSYKPGYWIYAQ